jgi:hypothetical protein
VSWFLTGPSDGSACVTRYDGKRRLRVRSRASSAHMDVQGRRADVRERRVGVRGHPSPTVVVGTDRQQYGNSGDGSPGSELRPTATRPGRSRPEPIGAGSALAHSGSAAEVGISHRTCQSPVAVARASIAVAIRAGVPPDPDAHHLRQGPLPVRSDEGRRQPAHAQVRTAEQLVAAIRMSPPATRCAPSITRRLLEDFIRRPPPDRGRHRCSRN